jgi:hypothetical protein
MPLNRDLQEFIECLNSNEVEYLVVDALAVSWHGFPRYSADVDFPDSPEPGQRGASAAGALSIRIQLFPRVRRRPADTGA